MALKFNRLLRVENELGAEKVPGMEGVVYIRKIPLGEAKALMGIDGMEGYCRILELSLCDSEGRPLPTEEIANLPFDASKALAEIASDWNGLTDKSQKALEKN